MSTSTKTISSGGTDEDSLGTELHGELFGVSDFRVHGEVDQIRDR